MKFNSTTHWISVMTMALYMLYILSALGIVGLIMSMAITLIVAAFVDSFEIVTASVVVVGVAYVIVSRWLGIKTACKSEGFSDGTPSEILGVVNTLNKKQYGPGRTVVPEQWREGPTGVLSGAVEGFADAGLPASDTKPKEGEQATSQPAKVSDKADLTSKLDDSAKLVADTINGGAAADRMKLPEEKKDIANFTDGSNAAGLFKLGELPSDSKDGPHLDAGSTLMKAMNALKPDQITAMTTDTQALLQTQQNLMGMLQSMSPILKDGRKLLDTFSGIFGNDSGLGDIAKQFKAGN